VRSHRTGDLMCRVVLETPVKLTREQKDMLRQFENTMTDDNTKHNPRSNSWLKGVREFFDRMTS
jgi:molecular chaperone DnaJ